MQRELTRDLMIGANTKQPFTMSTRVMNAAGILGFGDVFSNLYNFDRIGAVVTNPVTWSPRQPALGPRMIIKEGGVMLHTGLPNGGVKRVIRDYASLWQMLGAPVVMHLMATSSRDLQRSIERIEAEPSLAGIELGLHDDITWRDAQTFVRVARERCEKPIIVRLPFPGSGDVARAAVEGGADALVATAPPRGTERDPLSGRLMRTRIYGGLVRPMVLRAVGKLASQFPDVPIIGAGGILSMEDARNYLDVGAAAVQLDAALWVRPRLLEDVSRDLGGATVTRRTDSLPDEWHPGMGDTEAEALGLK
ncbi:MAG: nitronate monooxygenase [Anaerolineae bacterium]|nr:nitronate monooxygenase [Anaerolineae bacterium]